MANEIITINDSEYKGATGTGQRHCTCHSPVPLTFFIDRLDIPADYKLNLIIAIGYPDEQPEAKPRDESKVKFIMP